MGTVDVWIAYGICFIIGAAITLYIKRNRKKGKASSGVTSIPLAGPMLMWEMWVPKTKQEWDILLGKVYVAMAVYVGTTYHWYFYSFALTTILFNLEWTPDGVINWWRNRK